MLYIDLTWEHPSEVQPPGLTGTQRPSLHQVCSPKTLSRGSVSNSRRLWLGRECWQFPRPSLTRPAICSIGLLSHRGTRLAFGCSLHSVLSYLLFYCTSLTWVFSAELSTCHICCSSNCACLISCIWMNLLLFAFLFMDESKSLERWVLTL